MIISGKSSRLSQRPAGEKILSYRRTYAGAFGSGALSDQSFYRENGVCHCQGRSLPGAEVTLVTGPTTLQTPKICRTLSEITTAREMFEEALPYGQRSGLDY